MESLVTPSARYAVAAQCLAANPQELSLLYRSAVAPTLQAAELSLVRQPAEIELLRPLFLPGALIGGDLRHVLAAMLILFPFELPAFDLETVPDWLRPGFLEYLHSNPRFFPTTEGQNAHVEFIKRWTVLVEQKLASEAPLQCWIDAATTYVEKANLYAAYFSNFDLTALFRARGLLLDRLMRRVGHAIDRQQATRQGARVRIGILRSGWAPQAETFATLPIFEFIDRDRFEIVLLSMTRDGSEFEAYCHSRADQVQQLAGTLPEQAEVVRNLGLDLLFYGANLTSAVNPVVGLAGYRLAPVQVASICSPVTTGLPCMDYFLAGTLTEPTDEAPSTYTERLVRIEGSGICFNYGRSLPASPRVISKAALGLSPDEAVLVSGANFHKIGADLRQAWAEILAATPRTALVLYPFGPAWFPSYPVEDFRADMNQRLQLLGVAPGRLVLLNPFERIADIPKLLAIADLYLDSFPYSGATSLVDALRADLPPVTMTGQCLRFAQGAALLTEIGLTELVATCPDDYVAKVIALANSAARRLILRGKIKREMARPAPFLDPQLFVRKVEVAFTEMLSARVS